MSINAMKQALDLLETSWGNGHEDTLKYWNETAQVLRQAIAEAEKQEPVAWMKVWRDGSKNFYDHEPPIFGKHETYPLYTTPPIEQKPVHANDISQEPVDEMAKDRHEIDDDIYDIWVEKNA